MSTVEIRAGSQICKGQPRGSARHLRINVFSCSRATSLLFSGSLNLARLGVAWAWGGKGRVMLSWKKSRKQWLTWFPVLVLFGILAGTLGGVGSWGDNFSYPLFEHKHQHDTIVADHGRTTHVLAPGRSPP
jgi:hypothetical protein